MKHDARKDIVELLNRGDLKNLLLETGKLHGHFCPGVSLGVKAACAAMERLGGSENSGMEEYVALIECNNCFADGVQMATGCSFGNNALIYLDLGKTAFTLVDRKTGRGVRVATKPRKMDEGEDMLFDEETNALFEKVVKRREGTPGDEDKLADLWSRNSFAVLEKSDDDLFTITEVEPELPALAPIFDSQICAKCGEEVMETRAVFVNGEPQCLACAGVEYRIVAGKGISTVPARANR